MITTYENGSDAVGIAHENINHVRQLLKDNEIIFTDKANMLKARKVLGTANSTWRTVWWRRNENDHVYIDYVVTIK